MIRFLGLWSEASAATLARPGRTLLTALGAVLGVGSLVAITGLTTTASAQIIARIDRLAATEVVVTDAGSETGVEPVLEWGSEANLAALNGVASVGSRADLGEDYDIRATVVADPEAAATVAPRLQAASPGLAEAVGAEFAQGRWFDLGHSERADKVAVLGGGAAENLGVTDIARQQVVFVDAVPYVIVGILSGVDRQADLMNSVVIPDGTARALLTAEHPQAVHIETDLGAAPLIADQAPLALHPAEPTRLRALHAPEPEVTRAQVSADTQALLLVLGGVSLLAGMIGIMNTTLVSVLERTGEIGLRRAVGAARRHIALQFLAESGMIGLLGGLLGASAGTLTVVAVATFQGWTPASAWWVPLLGVALGVATGLAAGIIPALRAGRIEPAVALRSA